MMALLDQDSFKTQQEHAKTFGVTQPANFKRLKALTFITNLGNWVSYEFKLRDLENRFCK